jgi:hypothetical protein
MDPEVRGGSLTGPVMLLMLPQEVAPNREGPSRSQSVSQSIRQSVWQCLAGSQSVSQPVGQSISSPSDGGGGGGGDGAVVGAVVVHESVVGRALVPMVLVMVVSQSIQVKGH